MSDWMRLRWGLRPRSRVINTVLTGISWPMIILAIGDARKKVWVP